MPLLDALQPVTAQMTARYRRSPMPAFLAWWKAELVSVLPPRWQGWFQDRRETWLASMEPGELRLQREGAPEPLATFPLERDQDSVRADLRQLLGRGPNPDRRLVLALPAADVLLRSLQFPPAVEQNLRQVLAFEMDRQTPFKADQVYYDFRVEPLAAGRQLKVDLALAPRAVVDALVERAGQLQLALDGADVASAGPAPRRRGFNLLPEAARARRSNPQRRLNLILAASAALLLLLAMQQSVANRSEALDGLRGNVEQARVEAQSVTALRNQLNSAVAGAGYLTERKRQAPSVLRVLGDLSERIPDDTWLERMTFREGGLEIAGQSDESTKLIGLLQESATISNPAFMGQISPDARTRKERFTLNARYDLQPEADLPPAPRAGSASGTEPGGGEVSNGATADAATGDGDPDRDQSQEEREAADADAAPAR